MTGVRFPAGDMDIFLFTTASRPALVPTHPVYREARSPGVKLPGCEVDHSPPSIAEFKNTWSYNAIPPYVFMAWCLVNYRIRPHYVVLS
jgi:hypothetical protein